MAYQTLYRRFRPKNFDGIVGQDAIVQALRRQVQTGRIAHAYLFCGTRGTGKTTAAKIFARAINCQTPRDGDACGECPSCQALLSDGNIDIIEIDAASNNRVENVRDMIDKVAYAPSQGKYRVYIVDEVHMFSGSAFNAFLKTLEEPPPHVVFILATTEPQKLPATILSRCQRFDFKRLTVPIIEKQLQYILGQIGSDAEDAALAEIARAAEGSMRDGISLLDQCLAYAGEHLTAESVADALGLAGRAFLFSYVDTIAREDAAGALQRIDELMQSGKEAAAFSAQLAEHFRCMLVALSCQEAGSILECDQTEIQRYRDQGKMLGEEKALRLLEIYARLESEMRWAEHPRVLLELTALQSCRPAAEKDLSAILERLGRVEKKLEEGIPAAPMAKPAKAERGESVPKTETSGTSASPKAPPAEGKLWPAFLNAVKKSAPQQYAILKKARNGGMHEGALQIIFSKENSIFVTMLRQDNVRERLEGILSELLVQPGRILPVLEGDEQEPEEPPIVKESIEKAFEMFGRENVELEP